MGSEVGTPTNVRLPIGLKVELQKIAKAQKTSLSQIIITACENYVYNNTPGLCPSCHTQNPSDAKYCSNCGSPLFEETEEEREEHIKDILRRLKKIEQRFGNERE